MPNQTSGYKHFLIKTANVLIRFCIHEPRLIFLNFPIKFRIFLLNFFHLLLILTILWINNRPFCFTTKESDSRNIFTIFMKVRLSGLRASITFVHIRKFYKILKIAFASDSFSEVPKRSIENSEDIENSTFDLDALNSSF